jgi:hypothetical protein
MGKKGKEEERKKKEIFLEKNRNFFHSFRFRLALRASRRPSFWLLLHAPSPRSSSFRRALSFHVSMSDIAEHAPACRRSIERRELGKGGDAKRRRTSSRPASKHQIPGTVIECSRRGNTAFLFA